MANYLSIERIYYCFMATIDRNQRYKFEFAESTD